MPTAASEIALMKKDIETLTENVKELNGKMDNLTLKLLDPDKGLVVRVNKNTERLDRRDDEMPGYLKAVDEFHQMKRWKSNVTRALWGIYAAVLGWIVKVLFW